MYAFVYVGNVSLSIEWISLYQSRLRTARQCSQELSLQLDRNRLNSFLSCAEGFGFDDRDSPTTATLFSDIEKKLLTSLGLHTHYIHFAFKNVS